MKTTIDIPDDLYTELAAASSARGLSVEGFLLSSARQSLTQRSSSEGSTGDASLTLKERLASVWGKGDHEAVMEVQRIVDEEFSQIDPKDWE